MSGDAMTGSLTHAASTGDVYTSAGNANTVTLQGPTASITTSYVMRMPAAQSTGTQALVNDGSGNLNWQTLTSGTVTGVSGTAPISIGGTAAAPVIGVTAASTSASGVVTLASSGGTTAATVVQATDARLSDSQTPTGTASGDLSGNFPSPTVAKIQGTAVSSTSPTTAGQILRYPVAKYKLL